MEAPLMRNALIVAYYLTAIIGFSAEALAIYLFIL